MRLIDLAYKVLSINGGPLKAKPIWDIAVEKSFVERNSHGKTPWATIARDIEQDVIVKGDKSLFTWDKGHGVFNLRKIVPNELRAGDSRSDNSGILTTPKVEIPTITDKKIDEIEFYKPFADWLVKLEECTRAIPLGGNRFKDKWGTPDVIGIREPRKSDIIKPATEIVSAEIKVDTTGLITAFGQACSYKLFSHKSYIVVPKDSPEEDVARLDALGRIFGIGLILMDVGGPDKPRFEIRVRATKLEPDMFYVNKCMRLIEDELFS